VASDDEFWAAEVSQSVPARQRRRAPFTWARYLPESERSAAYWLALTLLVYEGSRVAVTWLVSLLSLVLPRVLVGASGPVGVVVMLGARLLIVGGFLWFARQRREAPSAALGLVVLSALASLVESLLRTLLQWVASTSSPGYIWIDSALSLIRANAVALVVVVSAFVALIVVWKREQVSDDSVGAASGAATPWQRALQRMAAGLGLSKGQDTVARRLAVCGVSTAFAVSSLSQLLAVPVTASLIRGSGVDGLWIVMSMLVTGVAMFGAAWVAYSRFRAPRSTWLLLAVPYAILLISQIVEIAYELAGAGIPDNIAQLLASWGQWFAYSGLPLVALAVVVWMTARSEDGSVDGEPTVAPEPWVAQQ